VQLSQTFSFFPSVYFNKIIIFIVRTILKMSVYTWPKHHSSHGNVILTVEQLEKKDKYNKTQAATLVFQAVLK